MVPRKTKRKNSKRPAPAPRQAKSARLIRPVARGSELHGASGVGPAFEKLVAVMARLRAANGCPWDREQTHATLRTYLLEEAYEVLDALDGADDAKFAEELGDLLLQILFHAQIAREESRFSISEVISEIYEKLIRRHPHVFGEKRAKDSAEVLRNWELIKKEERLAKQGAKPVAAPVAQGQSSSPAAFSSSFTSAPDEKASESLLDGVPRTLPALLEAFQLTRKAARIGFDWKNLLGIFTKLQEETGELRNALAGREKDPSRVEGEVGDILFVAVNLARFLDLDPELALKKANAKFSRRFREMERLAREQGTTLAQVPRPQMESFWDQAKLREQAPLLKEATLPR